MMQKPLALLAVASLTTALAAQLQNNAGLGGIYRQVALNPLTGNDGHLGCAVRLSDGHIFVSARGLGGSPPHRIYEFDAQGALLRNFLQPSVHDNSIWGMRDLAVDLANNLLGGSEFGLSVIDSNTGQLAPTISRRSGAAAVTQPIRGAMLGAAGGVIRALEFDPDGNNSEGVFYTANFAGPLVAADISGNVLSTNAVTGWSAYGLALDPVTGNLLVNSAPDFGNVAEVDIATHALTGRNFPMAKPGAAGTTLQGGLSIASSAAGLHAPWPTTVSLVELTQDVTSDLLTIRRLHLFVDTNVPPNVNGWRETFCETAVGAAGAFSRLDKTFPDGGLLRFRTTDPSTTTNGLPAWAVLNLFGDADVDGLTDLTGVIPGGGLMPEVRVLNPFSVPPTPFPLIVATSVGATVQVPTPPGLFPSGSHVRMQVLYVQPALTTTALPFAATNEIHFTRQ